MQVAAVILAAGESSRLGEPKQLVSLGGETLLERAIKAAGDASSRVVVVVGAQRSDRNDVDIVVNGRWQQGLGTSIRAGVAQAQDCDAVILMTCDQPLVTATHLRALIDARSEIAAAEYSGTLGIPAFFARSQFENLLALRDDEGAKKIIFANESIVAKVPMPEAAIDIDTPEQLAKFRSEWSTSDSATQG
ncbi:MAG: NTP transferase domain-containing protein [Chthoniobacterales bacterium]